MDKLDTSQWTLERMQAAGGAWRNLTTAKTAELLDGLALFIDDASAENGDTPNNRGIITAMLRELGKRHGEE